MALYDRVLITGASSGIGTAFAEELAARGSALVLVARRAARLETLAVRLHERYGVGVEVLPADLADPEQLKRVERRLADAEKPVDLVVNNAGVGETRPFVECSVDSEQRTLVVNALAPTRLCHAALTTMTRRGRGGIVNIASVAGQLPAFRNSATYGASKAYLCSLSESLRLEARAAGSAVAVTAVCPGYVRTEMTVHDRVPRFAWVTKERVVHDALRGVARNEALVVPGLLYRVAVLAARLLPRAVVRTLSVDAPKNE
ncbi:SDR family NAD(P)-dependent oxidoreductase [Streptomyces salinarius]|uniref:SDR family NAD(P)-dependent oxidoreductase n=1 Tax=Streptomyces salinarius TaxID=2762598 RepID=UPI0013DC41E3|nr:SDR family oxidoreductase [Streptomyces salinarius]